MVQRICIVDGCVKNPGRYGRRCNEHRYHGIEQRQVENLLFRSESFERFWSKVDTSGECWTWRDKPNRAGYGRLLVGSLMTERKAVLAHRYSYELHFGPVPPGMLVCHDCDNPACVRPSHLYLGDQRKNMGDMAVRGRHGHAKLTPEWVRKIRRLHRSGISQQRIAGMFGVSRSAIDDVVNRRTWKHVGDDDAGREPEPMGSEIWSR